MSLPSKEEIEHVLASITLAMPAILLVAHLMRTVAHRLHAFALTTKTKLDDQALSVVVDVADWIDQVAKAIAHAASLGVLARKDERERP